MESKPALIITLCNLLLVVVLLISITFQFRITSKIDDMAEDVETMRMNYMYVVIENEAIYEYIDNLDTYKTFNDALKGREELYSHLQHLEE